MEHVLPIVLALCLSSVVSASGEDSSFENDYGRADIGAIQRDLASIIEAVHDGDGKAENVHKHAKRTAQRRVPVNVEVAVTKPTVLRSSSTYLLTLGGPEMEAELDAR